MKVIIPFSELKGSYAAIQAVAEHIDVQAIKDALTSKNYEESLKECEGAGWKVTTSGIEFEIPSEKINQVTRAMVNHAGFIGGVVNAVTSVVKLLDIGLKPFLTEAFKGPVDVVEEFAGVVSDIVGEEVSANKIQTVWNGELLLAIKVSGEKNYMIDMLLGVLKTQSGQKDITGRNYGKLCRFETTNLKAALDKINEDSLTPRQELAKIFGELFSMQVLPTELVYGYSGKHVTAIYVERSTHGTSNKFAVDLINNTILMGDVKKDIRGDLVDKIHVLADKEQIDFDNH